MNISTQQIQLVKTIFDITDPQLLQLITQLIAQNTPKSQSIQTTPKIKGSKEITTTKSENKKSISPPVTPPIKKVMETPKQEATATAQLLAEEHPISVDSIGDFEALPPTAIPSTPSLEAQEREALLAIAQIPTPEFIDPEELAIQQNYSTENFFKALDNIDHSLWADEDINELLKIIK